MFGRPARGCRSRLVLELLQLVQELLFPRLGVAVNRGKPYLNNNRNTGTDALRLDIGKVAWGSTN